MLGGLLNVMNNYIYDKIGRDARLYILVLWRHEQV